MYASMENHIRTGNGRCPPRHGRFCQLFDVMLGSEQQTSSQRIKKVGKPGSSLQDNIVSRGYEGFYPYHRRSIFISSFGRLRQPCTIQIKRRFLGYRRFRIEYQTEYHLIQFYLVVFIDGETVTNRPSNDTPIIADHIYIIQLSTTTNIIFQRARILY
ncbi:hypothetical protein QTP88_022217 [Uroleucon formosanum]